MNSQMRNGSDNGAQSMEYDPLMTNGTGCDPLITNGTGIDPLMTNGTGGTGSDPLMTNGTGSDPLMTNGTRGEAEIRENLRKLPPINEDNSSNNSDPLVSCNCFERSCKECKQNTNNCECQHQSSEYYDKINDKKRYKNVEYYGKDNSVDEDVAVFEPLDGGYAWIILVSSILLQAMGCGLAYCVSILTVEWSEIYSQPIQITSWVGAINLGVLLGFGPFAGSVYNRYGARTTVIAGSLLSSTGLFTSAFCDNLYYLFLLYGLVAGFGFSLIYNAAVSVLGEYFGKYRSLALGLGASGVGAGSLAFAPLLRYLVDLYGVRGALMIEAGITLHGLLLGLLLRPIKYSNTKNYRTSHHIQSHRVQCSQIFELSLLREPTFWIYFMSMVMWSLGMAMIWVLLVDYGMQVGFHRKTAAYLVAAVGISNTVGRVIYALLSLTKCANSFNIYVLSTIISGGAIILYQTTTHLVGFAMFSVLFGLSFGFQLAVIGPLMIEEFGAHRLAGAFGYVMMSNGIGSLLVPPVAGTLYMVNETYPIPFYFAGSLTILSGILVLVVPFIKRFQPRHIEVIDDYEINEVEARPK